MGAVSVPYVGTDVVGQSGLIPLTDGSSYIVLKESGIDVTQLTTFSSLVTQLLPLLQKGASVTEAEVVAVLNAVEMEVSDAKVKVAITAIEEILPTLWSSGGKPSPFTILAACMQVASTILAGGF